MPEAIQRDETGDLRAALAAATRQRDEERNKRVQAETRLHGETGNRLAAEEVALDNAISQAKSAQSIAKQKWSTLQEEGKFAEAAEAMQEMSEASSRLTQLGSQKDYLARQRTMAETASRTPQADPMERFSPEEREWINKNPRYLTDETFQRKVNAAAMHAQDLQGIPHGSPGWFEAIERAVYPERFDTGEEIPGGERQPAAATEEREDGFSDTGEHDPGLQQHHTREMPRLTVQQDGQEMRIEPAKPEEPQQRAVGRGGAGLSATAAVPSRRIAQAGSRVTSRQVSLSPDEEGAAMALAEVIEPEILKEGRQRVHEWYYMMAHHPSHQKTRRRSWARDAVIA